MPAASPGRPRQRTQCCCRRRVFARAQVLPSLLVWNVSRHKGWRRQAKREVPESRTGTAPVKPLTDATGSLKPLLAPHLHSSGAQIHGSARAESDHPGLTPESFPAPGGHVTVLVKLLLHTDPTDFPSSTSRHEQKGSDFPSLCVPCCKTPFGSRFCVTVNAGFQEYREGHCVAFDPDSCLPGLLSCMQVLFMSAAYEVTRNQTDVR